MGKSTSQWEVADALVYAWRELRHMPVPIANPLAMSWIEALGAVCNALDLIASGAPCQEIAKAKYDVALAIANLRLVATIEVHRILDDIAAGVQDAGADLIVWGEKSKWMN
jgi:hypothetical protein